MKREMKRIHTLSEHQNMMDLLKQLYGKDNEIKDDSKVEDTNGEPGASSTGEMVKLPPNCS